MVFRVSLVPSIMGCHDGTLELCLAPDVDTTSAFYGGLFWIYSSHTIFQFGCKHSPSCGSLGHSRLPLLKQNSCAARKYYPHFDLITCATCMLDLVPCQLFPDGLKRVSLPLFLRKASSFLTYQAACRLDPTLSLGLNKMSATCLLP
jgi:hypothetical protein